MARPSTIDRQPPEIREEIGRLRREGRSIDEIVSHLRKLGVDDISRSALGRHTKEIDAVIADIQRHRAMAEAIANVFGDEAESKALRANVEVLQALISRTASAGPGEGASFEPKEVHALSAAVNQLSAAAARDTDRMLKLKRELAKQVVDAVDKGEAALADTRADPAEVLRKIREDVYGIFDR